MKAGQKVSVFQKPYDYGDFEGEAKLVNFITDDPEMECWEVEFEAEPDELYTRWFPKGDHEYFIVIGGGASGGYWGKGFTREKAEKCFVEAGGDLSGELVLTYRFTSRFEFAHTDEQSEDQADAWVDGWGRVNWSRCLMEKIS